MTNNHTKKTSLSSYLSILSWNIQSSKSEGVDKFSDPIFMKNILSHDIVCLQETRQAVKVPGYRSLCTTRAGEKYGGVAILLKYELIGGFQEIKKYKAIDLVICKLKKS